MLFLWQRFLEGILILIYITALWVGFTHVLLPHPPCNTVIGHPGSHPHFFHQYCLHQMVHNALVAGFILFIRVEWDTNVHTRACTQAPLKLLIEWLMV